MTNKDIGQRLKRLREERNMTQAAFAEKIGLNQSTVSRIEDGSRALTARELASASSALGITVETLLGERELIPALLRVGEADDENIRKSLDVFNACIDEFRGIETLAG